MVEQLKKERIEDMETENVSIETLSLTPEQQKAVGFLTEYSKKMIEMAFLENDVTISVTSVVKEIYRVFDRVLAGCLSKEPKLPCKIGCNWCCCLQVKVTPIEILCIIDHSYTNLRRSELSALRQRLVKADENLQVDSYRRTHPNKICPLIVDGKCIVYPVRPIACRYYHSLSASDCEMVLGNYQRNLKMRHDVSGIGLGVFAGMIEGLRSVGYQSRLLKLVSGLQIAFDEPKTMKRWMTGAPAFADAEIENAKEIESFYRLVVDKLGAVSD